LCRLTTASRGTAKKRRAPQAERLGGMEVVTTSPSNLFCSRLPLVGILAVGSLSLSYWCLYTLVITTGESTIFNFAAWIVVILLSWWVYEDSRVTHHWPITDYGFFLVFAWPIFVLQYLVKTRGWRGLLIFFVFANLAVAGTWGWVLDLVLGVHLITGARTTHGAHGASCGMCLLRSSGRLSRRQTGLSVAAAPLGLNSSNSLPHLCRLNWLKPV
jgi:hypothetical protein